MRSRDAPAMVSPFGTGVAAPEEPLATQLRIENVEASGASSRGKADQSDRLGRTAEAPPRRLQHAHVFMNPRMHRASGNPIHRRCN